MTMPKHPDAGTGDLRELAAAWFALMRGPEAERSRVAFDAWLARNTLHRESYSRIAEVFSLGKGLAGPTKPTVGGHKVLVRQTKPAIAIVAMIAIGVSGAALWTQSNGRLRSPAYPATTSIALRRDTMRGKVQTVVGQIRTIRLADGSRLTLDTNTAVAINFDGSRRQLRVLKGRARFNVTHEKRPFLVTAAAGTVTAHGTLFDVGIQANGAVHVRLLRGAIDVALSDRHSGRGGRELSKRLAPGQDIVFTNNVLMPAQTIAAPIDERWPSAELNCDHLTLSAVAAQANRYSTNHIAFGETRLGLLQVSGTFRIDDPEKLAAHLAALFDLRVEHDGPTRLVLRK